MRFPLLQTEAPFLKADRHYYAHPQLYSIPVSETYLPVTWAATWLLVGGMLGVIYLFRRNSADLFERGCAIAFACQSIGILSYYILAQRYSLDLFPFLLVCFLIFLRHSIKLLPRVYPILIGLVGLSITVNSLATLSWLIDADQNVRTETRAVLDRMMGRSK